MHDEKLTPEQAQEVIREAVRLNEITGSENRIAVERQRFEEAATRYEQTARRFPISLMRSLLGYPRTVERPQ